jgi:hypothetical protein
VNIAGKSATGADVNLSTLLDPADIEKVLAHPDMVVAGDFAGLLRETGINTNKKLLQKLVSRITQRVLTEPVLVANGATDLQVRLQNTASDSVPREVKQATPFVPTPSQVELCVCGIQEPDLWKFFLGKYDIGNNHNHLEISLIALTSRRYERKDCIKESPGLCTM